MVRNNGHSSRRIRFNSQNLHGGSQPCITPLLGDLLPPWHLWTPEMHMMYRHTFVQNIRAHKISIFSVHINVWKERGSCWGLGQAPLRRRREERAVLALPSCLCILLSSLLQKKKTQKQYYFWNVKTVKKKDNL